jgi:hypothetical protein
VNGLWASYGKRKLVPQPSSMNGKWVSVESGWVRRNDQQIVLIRTQRSLVRTEERESLR